MKRNRIIIATLLFSCAVAANAQNDRDAFRYSMLTPTGTARNTALGGSMGAFGADFSTASTNPAALGTYNRSEFSISPSLYFGSTKIEYNGETYKDYKPNFNLGNIGVVLTIPNDNESANWKAVQISTGINRMGNFNTYGYGCGPNMNGTSFIDYVAADANDKDIYTDASGQFTNGSYLGYLAWSGGLLGLDANNNFISKISQNSLMQEKSIQQKGSMNEYVFSISGNWMDKLFVGATLGIPYYSYVESYTYVETNTNRNEPFQSMTYQNYIHSEGSGINFKAGMLYQPFNFLRLGFAMHTPTYYGVEEEYDSRFTSHFDTLSVDKLASNGEFEYSINTPYRVLANAAFIFGNFGFINVDYEMADYSIMRLRSDSYSFRTENNSIMQMYRTGHTVRIGGELNLSPMALRAGYAYMSNPFAANVGRDASHQVFSAGIGFRSTTNYVDIAFQHVTNTDKDVFYEKSAYSYNVDNISNSVVVTAGWKF
jgi:hypothetical protein